METAHQLEAAKTHSPRCARTFVLVALAAQAACGAKAGRDEPPRYASQEGLQEVDEAANGPEGPDYASSMRGTRCWCCG